MCASCGCRTAGSCRCRPIRRAHAAGLDLLAAVGTPRSTLAPGARALVPTGLVIALPPGTRRRCGRAPGSRATRHHRAQLARHHRCRLSRRDQGSADQPRRQPVDDRAWHAHRPVGDRTVFDADLLRSGVARHTRACGRLWLHRELRAPTIRGLQSRPRLSVVYSPLTFWCRGFPTYAIVLPKAFLRLRHYRRSFGAAAVGFREDACGAPQLTAASS